MAGCLRPPATHQAWLPLPCRTLFLSFRTLILSLRRVISPLRRVNSPLRRVILSLRTLFFRSWATGPCRKITLLEGKNSLRRDKITLRSHVNRVRNEVISLRRDVTTLRLVKNSQRNDVNRVREDKITLSRPPLRVRRRRRRETPGPNGIPCALRLGREPGLTNRRWPALFCAFCASLRRA
jgi:hypothetical protein